MAHEDQTQKCSNSSSGGVVSASIGRSPKKQKQKKVPQRGLGVAQLERIRMEEQQKKGVSVILQSPSTLSPTKSSNLSVPFPNFLPPNQSSSSIPYPSHSRADLSSSSLVLRPNQLVQKIDIISSTGVPLVNPVNWQSVPVPGHGNGYNPEKEGYEVGPGLAFRSTMNLTDESNPIWPLPSLMQKGQQQYHQQQPHPSSSSMVNVSSVSSSSSVMNFQIEPPSNQIFYGNYTALWPEEEKMFGKKRPYPFSLDNPPGPSFPYKLPPIVHPPISRSDESASCGNGGTFNFDPSSQSFRGGPPCSTSISEANSKNSIKEDGMFNGNFLTLAPPTTASTRPTSKFKHPSSYLPFHIGELPDFDSLPYQGSVEDPVLWPGPSVPNHHHQQPYYCFFPATLAQINQATSTSNNCNDDNGEIGESVDLNLKL